MSEVHKNSFKSSVVPELIVLGAGPGDPELITMKGYRLLQHADAVLYDNLANQQLLSYTKPTCVRVYVGKRPYERYASQGEINELIKKYAYTYGSVVRLKGGDPFIFGRGFEEIMYARSQGIKTTFVPGITSMQASGFEDIPLTHRAVSEGVWMVTGTKKDGTLSADLRPGHAKQCHGGNIYGHETAARYCRYVYTRRPRRHAGCHHTACIASAAKSSEGIN
jgi:uroporphyrin-III C-methyltransferase